MFEPEHKHQGKAMIKQHDGMIEIVMDCDTCGRFSVGPFNIIHCRSIADMLDMVGEKLGLEVGKRVEVKSMSSHDPSIMEEGERLFEQMNMAEGRELLGQEGEEDETTSIPNPWSRKRSA